MVHMSSNKANLNHASTSIQYLDATQHKGLELSKETIQMPINNNDYINPVPIATSGNEHIIKTPKIIIKPRGRNQNDYLGNMKNFEVNFGVGPAGTGKTYLAVAKAVEMLVQEDVQKIILILPTDEAGEKLGCMLGDLTQKVDAYRRP